eukprot:CAMPEP_0169455836 /NCGR_PEP_ID=MMETSP1042-20121227/16032_1 /TAXON_ID=464988 /ORGANISM="Hemiselmis andersenii, Strain CCMP1180" /LENGTH=65 /DNA_ID=CAMNT_0009568019 /DNA_START=419 /DNA_END=613 /DNA_ORIENTATION=+
MARHHWRHSCSSGAESSFPNSGLTQHALVSAPVTRSVLKNVCPLPLPTTVASTSNGSQTLSPTPA